MANSHETNNQERAALISELRLYAENSRDNVLCNELLFPAADMLAADVQQVPPGYTEIDCPQCGFKGCREDQRVPLTLSQKQRLWSSVGEKPTLKDRMNAFARAIEAHHGIGVNP